LVASSLGVSAALLLDRVVARAATASPSDVTALNAAVELERAAIKAYEDAEASKLLSAKVLAAANLFKSDHAVHLAALEAAVRAGGGTPSTGIAKLAYPTLASEHDVVAFALKTEELAASTYLSVVPELNDRELAGLIASILGVETVHAGVLAEVLGTFPPYPGGLVK
jgi:rubrerythrin